MKKKEEEKVPRHLQLRFYGGEKQRERRFHPAKFPHVSPDSTLVVAIGTSWKPGAWQKVVDMVTYTSQEGISCWLNEIEDGCATLPFDSLDGMRNTACLYAQSAGFEWLLMVENDILPEPDLLVRLLKPQLPVMVPFIRKEGTNHSISDPPLDVNTGMQAVAWSVLSCVLIWTKVINCFPDCSPFSETKGEGPFFMKLMHFGHRVFMDTDIELKVASQPSYHGEVKDLNELWKFYEKIDKGRRLPPDRRPIDPKNPNQKMGVYMPAVLMAEENVKETK